MRRPRVAINAAVLATPIGIQARLETDIRAVITRNDRFRAVTKILCLASRPLPWHAVAVRRRLRVQIDLDNSDKSRERGIDIVKIDMQLFETIGRTPGGTAPANWR